MKHKMNDTNDLGNMLMAAVEGDKFNVVFEDGERLEDVLVTNVEQHEQYDRRVVLNNNESDKHVLFVEGRGVEYHIFALVEDDNSAGGSSELERLKPNVTDEEPNTGEKKVGVTTLSSTGKDIEYAMENSGI